ARIKLSVKDLSPVPDRPCRQSRHGLFAASQAMPWTGSLFTLSLCSFCSKSAFREEGETGLIPLPAVPKHAGSRSRRKRTLLSFQRPGHLSGGAKKAPARAEGLMDSRDLLSSESS